jgi:murein DD-endopeptidase MepM/ murein hydrolase activator NlpD
MRSMKILLLLIFFLFNSFNISASEFFGQILKHYDFTNDEIDQVLANYPELQDVQVAFDRSLETLGGQLTIRIYADNSNDIFTLSKSDQLIDVKRDQGNYQLIKKKYEGEIDENLYDSILSETQNDYFATIVSEAFRDELTSTKGLKVPAIYSFTVENFYEGEQLIKVGNVLNAKVIVGKALVEKTRTHDLEKDTWSLATIVPSEGERVFSSPVGTNLVSSVFNLARRHPVKRRRIQPHNGIDFVARSGTPVHPALEGEVIAIGRAKAKGKYVLIRHSNGFESTYDHLRKFKKGLRVGMYVDKKDLIGEVGRTGYATGAHLHFGLLKNGLYVNPIYYLTTYKLDNNLDADLEDADDNSRESNQE